MNEDQNVYQDYMLKHPEYFDFSAYPKDHLIWTGLSEEEIKRFVKMGAKVIGKFKDELGKYFIKTFIGIRAKCYIILKEEGGTKGKCKGLKASVEFEEYYNALHNNIVVEKEQTNFRSHKLEIGVEQVCKRAFDQYDDKRYILNGETFETLPYGHYKIQY